MDDIELIFSGSERDLGGFKVRRVLPHAGHPMVGPFIFFDHIGPADFKANEGIDVRPHPHINLATVTYLFEGKILHRDSLGSDQLIEPGAINWMTAGHGIVHSERTPADLRQTGSRLSGIQCWIALPDKFEEIAPSFFHYEKNTLPEFKINGVQCKLLLGNAFEHKSPVKIHSDLFYLVIQLIKNEKLNFPLESREGAVYIVEGSVNINGLKADQYTMVVGKKCGSLQIEAITDAKLMILGGKPVGERFIEWNFVSSSKEKIEQAKRDWIHGPSDSPNARFPKIPDDDQEFIPLPEEPAVTKGTIM